MRYTEYHFHGILFFMSDAEIRHIGNMVEAGITARSGHDPLDLIDALSPAEQWAQAGIEFRITAPMPTEHYTVEQLTASGLVGVELILPSTND